MAAFINKFLGKVAQTIFIPELGAFFGPREELERGISQDSMHLGKMIPVI
jgi:hypothetical protein